MACPLSRARVYTTRAQVKFSTPSKPRPATIQAPIPMSTMNLVKVGTA